MYPESIKSRFLFLFALIYSQVVLAGTDSAQVQELLQQTTPPSGVVFEIASKDKDALQWAIPRIRQHIATLRNKYPSLEVAIVTHGREQFALQTEHDDSYRQVHESVKSLSTEQGVPVHICQTFAAWNNVEPEQFPDYVTVSATGPQQVNDYIDLGYTLIKIRR